MAAGVVEDGFEQKSRSKSVMVPLKSKLAGRDEWLDDRA
jgi:hypothetical protein